MRKLYTESNITLDKNVKIDCHNALVALSANEVTELLAFAVQEAHTQANPPITPQEFWDNLFITRGTNNNPLLDEGKPFRQADFPTNNSPYMTPDLICWVKFLFFGRQRQDSQGAYIKDTDVVLDYFNIAYNPSLYSGYVDRAYARHLRAAMNIRKEKLGHVSPAALAQLTMESLTNHRDTMLELLDPFCKKRWTHQQTAIKLQQKIIDEFYDKLGDIQYSVERIMNYTKIPTEDKTRVIKILTGAGLTVVNDKVTLSINPTELSDELAAVWKKTSLSDESKAALLYSRLPGNEIELTNLYVQNDNVGTVNIRKLSNTALEELVMANNPEAIYVKASRLYHSKDGDKNENRKAAATLFEQSAEANYAPAQTMWAGMLMDGIYTAKDLHSGIYWLRMAYTQKHPSAIYQLGVCYERGLGVSKDLEKAFCFYSEGANLNHVPSQLKKAYCLMNGLGTKADEDIAVFEYQRLYRADNKDACIALSKYYYKKDPEYALPYLVKAAELGDATSLYLLAGEYESGVLVEEDRQKAIELYVESAIAGDKNGLYWLGLSCKEGINNQEKDLDKANYCFVQAARKHHTKAQYEAGCYLLKHGFMEKNAVEFLTEAASHNHAPSALRLGEYYEQYHSYDYEKMMANYTKAADLGLSEGYYRIAKFYDEAAYEEDEDFIYQLVHPDYLDTAHDFAIKAINAGHKEATFYMIQELKLGNFKDRIPPYMSADASLRHLAENMLSYDVSRASYYLGFYWEEKGELEQSISYYENATEYKPDCYYKVGQLYEKLTRSDARNKAYRAYLKGAEHNNPECCYRMYEILECGLWGFRANEAYARNYLEKAANLHHVPAMIRLGNYYNDGKLGLAVDYEKADKWYDLALDMEDDKNYELTESIINFYRTLRPRH